MSINEDIDVIEQAQELCAKPEATVETWNSFCDIFNSQPADSFERIILGDLASGLISELIGSNIEFDIERLK